MPHLFPSAGIARLPFRIDGSRLNSLQSPVPAVGGLPVEIAGAMDPSIPLEMNRSHMMASEDIKHLSVQLSLFLSWQLAFGTTTMPHCQGAQRIRTSRAVTSRRDCRPDQNLRRLPAYRPVRTALEAIENFLFPFSRTDESQYKREIEDAQTDRRAGGMLSCES